MNDPNLMAKLFSESLKDDALEWYYTLPSQSITSFKMLTTKLTKNYRYHVKPETKIIDFYELKQRWKFSAFIKVWRRKANEIIVEEENIRQTLVHSLIPQLKIEASRLGDLSLTKVIKRLLNKASFMIEAKILKYKSKKENYRIKTVKPVRKE